MATEYRVRLDAFEGPLDLLLYLIRRAEVEITDIPIAGLTDQYLSFLGDLEDRRCRIDIDTAGEFLVMAATLMEIKSRMIARSAEPAAGCDDADAAVEFELADPRAELVRQLLEYKKYRDMADGLEARRQWWELRFPAAAAGVDRAGLAAAAEGVDELDIDELDLVDLIQAFRKIIASVNLAGTGEHEVIADDTPIELHAEDIVDQLDRAGEGGKLTLAGILSGRRRAEMVGLFLALLDLIRRQRVWVRQEAELGEVTIELRAEAEAGGGESDGPGAESVGSRGEAGGPGAESVGSRGEAGGPGGEAAR